jgi:hypothetical protein
MNVLIRVTNPSKHCLEPYKSIWQNGDAYFIQVSKDPENPNWLEFGNLLAETYKNYVTDDDFIENHIKLYEDIKSSNSVKI